MVILTLWGMELKSVCLLTSKQLHVARNSLKQILIYVPLVKALLTLSFPSVQYVWTTWLTTILKFSKLASDGWEYSLAKQRIAILATLDGKASVFVYACQVGVGMPCGLPEGYPSSSEYEGRGVS